MWHNVWVSYIFCLSFFNFFFRFVKVICQLFFHAQHIHLQAHTLILCCLYSHYFVIIWFFCLYLNHKYDRQVCISKTLCCHSICYRSCCYLDYFDTELGVLSNKDSPSTTEFAISLLREILLEIGQGHRLYPNLRLGTFLLHLGTR